MTIANGCLLAACMLPIITVGFAKFSRGKLRIKEGGYNNFNPREWARKQEGWKARAIAAQENGFEALPFFIAGVLVAQQAHANQQTIDMLASAFVGVRLVYTYLYLQNLAALRSLVWVVGLGICISFFAII